MSGKRGNSKNLAATRRERIMNIHSRVVSNYGDAPRRKRLFRNPFLAVTGGLIVVFVVIVLSRFGASPSAMEYDPFIVVNQRIYKATDDINITGFDVDQYIGDVFANIDAKNVKTAPFNDFDGSAFDAGTVYTLKHYEDVIAVRYDGRFIPLRYVCDVKDR